MALVWLAGGSPAACPADPIGTVLFFVPLHAPALVGSWGDSCLEPVVSQMVEHLTADCLKAGRDLPSHLVFYQADYHAGFDPLSSCGLAGMLGPLRAVDNSQQRVSGSWRMAFLWGQAVSAAGLVAREGAEFLLQPLQAFLQALLQAACSVVAPAGCACAPVSMQAPLQFACSCTCRLALAQAAPRCRKIASAAGLLVV